MKYSIIKWFFFPVLLLSLGNPGLASSTSIQMIGVADVASSSYYDVFLENEATLNFSYLTFNNRAFLGITDGSPYIVDSFYIEGGITGLLLGYGNTALEGTRIGTYPKYTYPPLKEEPSLFFFNDFAYTEHILDRRNSLLIDGFVPIQTLYANWTFGSSELRIRSFQVTSENALFTTIQKELKFGRDLTLEFTHEVQGWKHGLFYVPGSMSDYYYTNAYSQLDSSVPLTEDQYKEVLIYGVQHGPWLFNIGLYDKSRFHFITLQLIDQTESLTHILLVNWDAINKGASLFWSRNYERELYLSLSYERANDPDYFISMADLIPWGVGFIRPMICFKSYLQRQKLAYSLGWVMYLDNGIFDIQLGNTPFSSVWDGWSVLPNQEQNFILKTAYKGYF